MPIKTLGSLGKIRVGRGTGNTHIFFLASACNLSPGIFFSFLDDYTSLYNYIYIYTYQMMSLLKSDHNTLHYILVGTLNVMTTFVTTIKHFFIEIMLTLR